MLKSLWRASRLETFSPQSKNEPFPDAMKLSFLSIAAENMSQDYPLRLSCAEQFEGTVVII